MRLLLNPHIRNCYFLLVNCLDYFQIRWFGSVAREVDQSCRAVWSVEQRGMGAYWVVVVVLRSYCCRCGQTGLRRYFVEVRVRAMQVCEAWSADVIVEWSWIEWVRVGTLVALVERGWFRVDERRVKRSYKEYIWY